MALSRHYLRSDTFTACCFALLSDLAGVHHSAELDVVQLPVSRLVELLDRSLYLQVLVLLL